jgi:hypothetical protein
MRMKVFYSTDFEGFYPVGTAAIVIASNEEEARTLLDAEIKKHGLPDTDYTLHKVSKGRAKALIIVDGNY